MQKRSLIYMSKLTLLTKTNTVTRFMIKKEDFFFGRNDGGYSIYLANKFKMNKKITSYSFPLILKTIAIKF